MKKYEIRAFLIVIAVAIVSSVYSWAESVTFGSVMTVLWIMLIGLLIFDYFNTDDYV